MSFELLVRPAACVPVLKTPSTLAAHATQDGEAAIEWGSGPLATAAREATVSGPYTGDDGNSVNPPFDWQEGLSDILYPGDPGYPFSPGDPNYGLGVVIPPDWSPDEETPTYVLDEKERKSHTIRITSAANPSDYVDVEVIDTVAFDSPFGTIVLRFNNPK